MRVTWARVPVLAFALITLYVGSAHADESGEKNVEHTFIVGIGAAGELELGSTSGHAGLNAMLEWETIDNWLELELGASILAADGGIELPVDLLVKKPFRLSPRIEYMVGVGPEITRVSNPSTTAARFGAEAALDVMFWPTHRIGGWVEPAYEVAFHDGVSQSLGLNVGVIVGW